MGRANTGKSSLMNALLQLSRQEALQVTKVGEEFGTTRNIIPYKIKDQVYLIDTPTLNSESFESKTMIEKLRQINLTIFVVTGFPTLYDQELINKVKKYSNNPLLIVLNQIDKWDNCGAEYLDYIVNKWKKVLDINDLYLTCTKGWDSKSKISSMDVRGVGLLRKDIFNFIDEKIKEKTFVKSIEIIDNKADLSQEKINDNISIDSILESCQKTAIASYNTNLKYSQELAKILAIFKNNISKKNYSNSQNKHR